MWRTDLFEKTHAGKDWRQEEKGTTEDEMVDGITDTMDMSLSKFNEIVKPVCFTLWGWRVGHNWVTEQQSNSKSVKILYVGIAFKMKSIQVFKKQFMSTENLNYFIFSISQMFILNYFF